MNNPETYAQTLTRSMGLHGSTFEYLKPTDQQVKDMANVRAAAKVFCDVLESILPNGPDKTFVIRSHRTNAMWANVAITRLPDGAPRVDPGEAA